MTKTWRHASSLAIALTFSTVVAAQSRYEPQPAPMSAAERQQGNAASAEIVTEYGGAYSGRQAQYVERVGRRIAVQSGLSPTPAHSTSRC